MNISKQQIEHINQYIKQCSSRNSERDSTYIEQNKSTDRQQILCRISFDIDGETHQLQIRQNSYLHQITDQLIQVVKQFNTKKGERQIQITHEQVAMLQEEIQLRIQEIMEQNQQKTLQTAKWKNKLRDIINNVSTPINQILRNNQHHPQDGPKNSQITYFGFKSTDLQANIKGKQKKKQQTVNKNRQLYERIKNIQKQLNYDNSKSTQPHQVNRLYQIGKDNQLLKDYLAQANQSKNMQSELSECTFHPNIHKNNSQNGKKSKQSYTVFDRLYNQAQEKKIKMKQIQKQITERQDQQLKHMNFIPVINSCSKQIIKAKKQFTESSSNDIYENLYQEAKSRQRKEHHQQWSFRPAICPKSQSILKYKGNSANKSITIQHDNKTKKVLGVHQENSLFFGDKNQKKIVNKNNLKAVPPKFNASIQRTQQQNSIKGKRVDKMIIQQSKPKAKAKLFTCENEQVNKQPLHSYSKLHTARSVNSTKINKTKPIDNIKDNFTKAKGLDNLYINCSQLEGQHILTYKTNQTCNTEEGQYPKTYGLQFQQPATNKSKHKRTLKDPLQFLTNSQKHQKAQPQNKTQTSSKPTEKDGLLQNLYGKRKALVFQSIFNLLTHHSDNKQEVTSNSILNNSIIPTNLKSIFDPMAQQMQELNVGLDKQQFVWSMTRIFQNLSLPERGQVLAWGLNASVDQTVILI